MNLYVFGDYHGGIDGEDRFLSVKEFPEQKNMSKEQDIVFQLGDFGLPWYYPQAKELYKKDINQLNQFALKKFTLFVIPGNHENYDLINSLPLVDFYKGKAYLFETKNGPIYYAKRGEIYEINNQKIFTFSGAKTMDMEERYTYKDFLEKKKVLKSNKKGFKRLKTMKISYVQYWPQEIPTEEEYSYAISNLRRHNFKVDFILSHTGPSSILKTIFKTISDPEDKERIEYKKEDPVAEFLEEIYKKINFKEWHFGHIHLNKKVNNLYSHYKKAPVLIHKEDI